MANMKKYTKPMVILAAVVALTICVGAAFTVSKDDGAEQPNDSGRQTPKEEAASGTGSAEPDAGSAGEDSSTGVGVIGSEVYDYPVIRPGDDAVTGQMGSETNSDISEYDEDPAPVQNGEVDAANQPSENPAAQPDAEPAAEKSWGLSMTVQNATSAEATLVFTQSGGDYAGEMETGYTYLVTGEDYSLEVLQDGQWVPVKVILDSWVVTAAGYGIPYNDSLSWQIDFARVYGELPSGTYRIAKDIRLGCRGDRADENKTYYAEFTVTQ